MKLPSYEAVLVTPYYPSTSMHALRIKREQKQLSSGAVSKNWLSMPGEPFPKKGYRLYQVLYWY